MWTGTELIVWGGDSQTRERWFRDGAAYNPTTRKWRKIAPAPASLPSAGIGLWTGKEVILFGREDGGFSYSPVGAAYDPAHDRWRALPPAPLNGGTVLAAVWTGADVIVVGSSSQRPNTFDSDVLGSTVVYSPATDRWSPLPTPPPHANRQVASVHAVWAGDRLVEWWEWAIPTTKTCEPLDSHFPNTGCPAHDVGIERVSYVPARNRWTHSDVPSDGPNGIQALIWTGRDVLIPNDGPFNNAETGGGGPRWLYDPISDHYTRISQGPMYQIDQSWAWTGQALFAADNMDPMATDVWKGRKSDGWDPVRDTWVAVPRSPSDAAALGQVVWTGHELLGFDDQRLSGPNEPPGTGPLIGLALTPTAPR